MDGSVFGYCKSDNTIPIAHLDYGYVKNCNDAKYLEKIIKILRSGEEGSYPDLIVAAESRLKLLKPSSKLFVQDVPSLATKDLPKADGNELTSDIENWANAISQLDQTLLKAADNFSSESGIPPIRQQTPLQEKEVPVVKSSTKSQLPRSYKEWDSFNAEKEIENADNSASLGQESKLHACAQIEEKVNITGNELPEQELKVRASQEKDKGNESFREGNYNEAFSYYNRSLSIYPLTAVYNNRAIALIKLERYHDAIEDCNTVLKEEPSNLKAYLRRAYAFQSLKDYERATADLQKVLSMEPGNKRAKELLKEIEPCLKEVKVDELAAEEGTGNSKTSLRNGNTPMVDKTEIANDAGKKKGTRIKIVEVDETKQEDGDTDEENVARTRIKEDAISDQSLAATNHHDELKNENLNTESKQDDEEWTLKPNTRIGKKIKIVEVENESDLINSNSVNSKCKTSNEENTIVEPTADCNATVGEQKVMQGSDEERALEENGYVNGSLEDQGTMTVFEPPLIIPDKVLKLKDDGNTYFKAGNYSVALEKYSEAVTLLLSEQKLNPDACAILLSNRATCRLKIGDCKGCIQDASESIAYKATAKAFLRRASAYDTLEKYPEAYVDYQAAVRIDPSSKSAWDASTRIIGILRGRHGSNWRDKLPSLPEVRPQALCRRNGSNGTIQMPEKVAESVKEEEQTRIAEAKPVEESVDEKFRKSKEKGNKFVQQSKFKEAVECYTVCINLMPKEVASYTNRALCYLKLQKLNEAEQDCTKALELQPSNVKALFRRAQAKKASNNLRESIADLMNLLKLEPDNSAAKKELELCKESWRQELRKIQSQQESSKLEIKKSNDEPKQKKDNGKGQQQRVNSQAKISQDGLRNRKGKGSKAGALNERQQVGPVNTDRPFTVLTECTESQRNHEELKLYKATPFEFWRAWNSVKRKDDTKAYAKILSQIDPSRLTSVFSNKIDGDVIPIVVSTVHDHFLEDERLLTGFRLLEELTKVNRFKMALMFLSMEDTAAIRRTILDIERRCQEQAQCPVSLTALSKLKLSYAVK